MSSDGYDYTRSAGGKPHRHHHHHRGGSSRKSGRSGGLQLSLESDGSEYSPEAAGQSIAKWRHEAHVKDHEIKILRRMVQNAKTEIQKKEQTVAKMVERLPAFQNENKGFSTEALDMIETLERKLSEREYQTLKVQQDLESAQAAVTERNERIHDLCLQWEKSTQLLKEARERDLAELHKQIRHLEEEVIPALRSRAEAAEAREKQLKNELTVAHARIKQIEAMAQEKLAQKERQLGEATRRIRELELDLEHVMAAAARYTRREVLVEHLGGQLQNAVTATTPMYQDLPSVPIAQATPGMYTPAAYQPLAPEAYAPFPSASQQAAAYTMPPSEPAVVASTPASTPAAMTMAPPQPTPQAAPVAPPPPAPAPPVPPPPAPTPPQTKPAARQTPSKSVSFAPPAPPAPPKAAAPSPAALAAEIASRRQAAKEASSTSTTTRPPPAPEMAEIGYDSDPEPSPKPPPLPGQGARDPSTVAFDALPDPTQMQGKPRHKFSFQEHIPENSPRHRLSVIMRKLKDPVGQLRGSLDRQSPVTAK